MNLHLQHVGKIADELDAERAKLAAAKILVILGSSADWGSDELGSIAEVLDPVRVGTDLPAFGDQDEDAFAFWQGYAW